MDSNADDVVRVVLCTADDVIAVTVVIRECTESEERGQRLTSWTPRLRSGLAERRFAEALDPAPAGSASRNPASGARR